MTPWHNLEPWAVASEHSKDGYHIVILHSQGLMTNEIASRIGSRPGIINNLTTSFLRSWEPGHLMCRVSKQQHTG